MTDQELTKEAIVELATTLNELDALKEITTLTSEYPGSNGPTMAIMTEEYAVFWSEGKRRWNWSKRGRRALEQETGRVL